MSTFLKLAYRNIWRNKRRTLITAAAVAFAVFSASVMRSFQKGIWDNVVEGSIELYYGHAQIHADGYWEEQTLDRSFAYEDSLIQILNSKPEIKNLIPRIQSFALASEGEISRGVLVTGIVPKVENAMTGLEDKIIKGSYIQHNDKSVIVAAGLAEKLKLSINDSIILLTQGYRGINAAGKYKVKGIFEFSLPDLNKRLVYMPLSLAQEYLGAEGRITSIVLHISDKYELNNVVQKIKSQFSNDSYEVMTWVELIPELVQARQLDEAGGFLILSILYVLITFGIFGTIIMMTKERQFEFGLLTAIGMKRKLLSLSIWFETIILGLLGALIGIMISLPAVWYLHTNPIPIEFIGEGAAEAFEKFGINTHLGATVEFSIFLYQALAVLVITSILAFYPLWVINKLKPIEAMNS